MGMIFAPTIFKSFKLNTVPKLRPTQDASPGTLSMSNNLDRARMADDVNAGVLRLGRRAGIDPVTMKELETKFAVETRANAHALVDGAIMRGHMESPTFRFQAKTHWRILLARRQINHVNICTYGIR
jgi:2-hydroxychromene-2-carboxylate isomerase